MQNDKQKMLNILEKTYPRAKIALVYSNPLELLIAVILSAQCTDLIVNKVTKNLFAKYRTLNDYLGTDQEEFERDIRSTGFYHNKAKNILASLNIISDKYKGKVPDTMDQILSLPGVARKTANIVLGNAYAVVEGIAVDTHVLRISQRLRLVDLTTIGGKRKIYFQKGQKDYLDYIKDANPDKVESELMGAIPRADWYKINYMIVDHGRTICKSQNPECKKCPLNKLCPASRV